eukprot:TRINITY_DN2856_c0_g1_i1.p1 TRINITY_DN2856_c0_g1~~TRINITY_DN2856_c0_g1_i1.p1  ORF type:complete len:345 (-),score=28.91 TRINITY_DN2856_c0_g1_i1:309-1343(-)
MRGLLTSLAGLALLSLLRKRQKLADRRRHAQSRLANRGTNILQDETGARIFKVVSLANDVELYCRRWNPQPGVKVTAVLVMVHGLTFHSGYFGELAKYLGRFGIAVISYDMVGHGLSGSIEGFRCYFDQYESLLDDLNQITELALSEHPSVPLFLYGESFGGHVVLSYCMRPGVRDLVSGGIILSAVPIRIPQKYLPPGFVIPVLKFFSNAFPKLKLPGSSVGGQGYNESFGDLDIRRQVSNDELAYRQDMRMRVIVEVLDATQQLQENLEALLPPMLILHGDSDERVSLSCSEELMRRSGSIDKSIEVFEDGRHQLLQDEQVARYRVFQAIDQWLQMHMTVPA